MRATETSLPRWGRGTAAEPTLEGDAIAVDEVHHADAPIYFELCMHFLQIISLRLSNHYDIFHAWFIIVCYDVHNMTK